MSERRHNLSFRGQPLNGAVPWFTVVAIGLILSSSVFALDVPKLRGRVNDYAEMLSPGACQELEEKLAEFERSDSSQVVVLTVPSLEGDAIEEFSIRVAEAWKIGKKGRDNGVILLIARADRKMRIEVGMGFEARLTDLLAGRILDLVVRPRLKAGDFDGGIVSGVDAIIAVTRGEFKAPEKTLLESYRSIGPFYVLGAALLLAFVTAMILGRLKLMLWQVLVWPAIILTAMSAHSGWPGFGGGLFVLFALFILFWTYATSDSRGDYSYGGGSTGPDSTPDIDDTSATGGSSPDSDFSGGGGDFGGGGSSSDW